MAAKQRKPLDYYLNLQYPFEAVPEPQGGYLIRFPDLPGCLAQVETMDQVAEMAQDVFTTWMEVSYEEGDEIPLPSYPEEYSGKFVLRLPKSVHRRLAEEAKRDGVSLNTYAAVLLAEQDSQRRVERQLAELASCMAEIRVNFGCQEQRAPVSGDLSRTLLPTKEPVALAA